MFIKFGNTSGYIYELKEINASTEKSVVINDQNNILDDPILGTIPNVIGYSMILHDNGIIIFDRKPEHLTSQIEFNQLYKTLKTLLKSVYSDRSDQINIYLPRLTMDIYEEARLQNQMHNLTNKSIRMIYV